MKCSKCWICRWRVEMPTANSSSPHVKLRWAPVWPLALLTVWISGVLEIARSQVGKVFTSTSWEFPASQSIKQCVCENQLIVGCSGLYLSCLHGPSVQPREDSIKDKEELCLVEFLKLVSRKCDLTIATKINPTWAIQDWLTQLTCIPVLQTSRPDTVRNACHFFFFFYQVATPFLAPWNQNSQI